jgi:hypothetical protein
MALNEFCFPQGPGARTKMALTVGEGKLRSDVVSVKVSSLRDSEWQRLY